MHWLTLCLIQGRYLQGIDVWIGWDSLTASSYLHLWYSIVKRGDTWYDIVENEINDRLVHWLVHCINQKWLSETRLITNSNKCNFCDATDIQKYCSINILTSLLSPLGRKQISYRRWRITACSFHSVLLLNIICLWNKSARYERLVDCLAEVHCSFSKFLEPYRSVCLRVVRRVYHTEIYSAAEHVRLGQDVLRHNTLNVFRTLPPFLLRREEHWTQRTDHSPHGQLT